MVLPKQMTHVDGGDAVGLDLAVFHSSSVHPTAANNYITSIA
jgi:hypothetical protein